jgi:hypothetical protein
VLVSTCGEKGAFSGRLTIIPAPILSEILQRRYGENRASDYSSAQNKCRSGNEMGQSRVFSILPLCARARRDALSDRGVSAVTVDASQTERRIEIDQQTGMQREQCRS